MQWLRGIAVRLGAEFPRKPPPEPSSSLPPGDATKLLTEVELSDQTAPTCDQCGATLECPAKYREEIDAWRRIEVGYRKRIAELEAVSLPPDEGPDMTPDFQQIAQQLAEDGSESGLVDEEYIEDIAEQFRLVWNARGAADITAVEQMRSSPDITWLHVTVAGLSNAIATLDR